MWQRPGMGRGPRCRDLLGADQPAPLWVRRDVLPSVLRQALDAGGSEAPQKTDPATSAVPWRSTAARALSDVDRPPERGADNAHGAENSAVKYIAPFNRTSLSIAENASVTPPDVR